MSLNSLNYAHSLAIKDKKINIINCPINKNLLKKNKIGVTEYLAKKCKVKDSSEAMLIKNKNFAVSPITTHIDVNEISKKLIQKLFLIKFLQFIDGIKINLKKNQKLVFWVSILIMLN